MNEYTTDRLIIRHLEETDVDVMHRVIYSDAEVCRFFCGPTRPLEQVRRWLLFRSYQSHHESWGLMAVEITATNEVIGLVGIQPYAMADARMVIEADAYNRPRAWKSNYPMCLAKRFGAKATRKRHVCR